MTVTDAAIVPARSTEIGALPTTQVKALTTASVTALSTTQVDALTTTQIAAFSNTQVAALTTTSIAALTTTQLGGLTSTQVGSLSATQIGALSTTQIGALTKTIVLEPTSNPAYRGFAFVLVEGDKRTVLVSWGDDGTFGLAFQDEWERARGCDNKYVYEAAAAARYTVQCKIASDTLREFG